MTQLSNCGAMDKIFVGRRELWARCRYIREHDGTHHDPKFPHHRWDETFYEEDFVKGKVKIPTKRKVRTCKHCDKSIRTDGAIDACVCKETQVNRKQSVLFAEEREQICRDANAMDLENDLAWLDAKWSEADRLWHKMIAESDEPYYGQW